MITYLHKRGFSLIELMVVIGIIVMMLSVAFVAIGEARKNTRDKARVADLAQIEFALNLYAQKNRDYPSYDGGVEVGVGEDIDEQLAVYWPSIPTDPKSSGASNTEYSYWYHSDFECGGTNHIIVLARTMERGKSSNFNDVCGESLSTEPPSTFLSHFATPADGYHVVYSQGYYQGYYQGSYFYSQAEYYAEGSYYNQSTYDGGSQGTYYSESGYSTQELNLTPEQLAGSYIVILD